MKRLGNLYIFICLFCLTLLPSCAPKFKANYYDLPNRTFIDYENNYSVDILPGYEFVSLNKVYKTTTFKERLKMFSNLRALGDKDNRCFLLFGHISFLSNPRSKRTIKKHEFVDYMRKNYTGYMGIREFGRYFESYSISKTYIEGDYLYFEGNSKYLYRHYRLYGALAGFQVKYPNNKLCYVCVVALGPADLENKLKTDLQQLIERTKLRALSPEERTVNED